MNFKEPSFVNFEKENINFHVLKDALNIKYSLNKMLFVH